MNYVLIILFALGPLMGILAGIAFDTLPLVYNIPSFENDYEALFATKWNRSVVHTRRHLHGEMVDVCRTSGIGIILMCLALLTMTSSAMDIVKQKSKSGEVGVFSYAPGLVLVICASFIAMSWFTREITGMIEVGVAFIVAIFCTMMMSTTLLSHFNRRLGWNATNPRTLSVRFLSLLVLGFGYVLIVSS